MAGRPPHYETAEELEEKIDAYFEYVKGESATSKDNDGLEVVMWTREPEPITLTGLAIYLGFESRQSLYDYEKNDQFSYIIKRARLFVEHEYEKRLRNQSPTGAIFALKNMGWKDKSEVDISTPQGITVNYNNQPGNAPLTDAG